MFNNSGGDIKYIQVFKEDKLISDDRQIKINVSINDIRKHVCIIVKSKFMLFVRCFFDK